MKITKNPAGKRGGFHWKPYCCAERGDAGRLKGRNWLWLWFMVIL